jgi:hypothetical protein
MNDLIEFKKQLKKLRIHRFSSLIKRQELVLCVISLGE